jgi:hypothetical protein
MLPLPILTTTTPLMSEMLMMIFAVMMHKKTLLPWQEEQGGTQSQEETRKLRDTIKQKDQQIVLLEKENAELKSTKTINVTQIEHKSVPAAERPTSLRNVIFKGSVIAPDTHQQQELQLVRLHNWIGEHFVSRLSARYEWFALWRMLYDKKLIEGTRAMTSKFAKQMNDWYPDAPYPCIEGEVNRFRNGYLGQTPFSLWDENAYLSKLHGKQSYSAFRQLYDLCEDLKNTLKTDDFYM